MAPYEREGRFHEYEETPGFHPAPRVDWLPRGFRGLGFRVQGLGSDVASNIHQAVFPGELEGADAPSLWSMGLSSVTAVQLVTSLSNRLHVALPPTLVFDHPTAEAVVRYVEAGRRWLNR